MSPWRYQWERHGCRILTAHVNYITSCHFISIEQEDVEYLALRRCPWQGLDAGGCIEDRCQASLLTSTIAEAGLLRANPVIAAKIQAHRCGSSFQQPIDGLTEQAVIDGSSVSPDVGFADGDQADGHSVCRPGWMGLQNHIKDQITAMRLCQRPSVRSAAIAYGPSRPRQPCSLRTADSRRRQLQFHYLGTFPSMSGNTCSGRWLTIGAGVGGVAADRHHSE